MEDLVYITEQLGFRAEGARIALAGLLKVNGPVIVHLNKGEFQHFSVLRGIHGMTVYLADPITGSVPMSLGMFLDQFTGMVLAVWNPGNPLPSEYVLKLGEQDTFYGNAFDAVRSSLYGHDLLRSIRPAF